MSDIKKLNKITSILIEYSGVDDELDTAAEHDEIFLGGPDYGRLEKSAIDELEALGCTWNDGLECWHIFT